VVLPALMVSVVLRLPPANDPELGGLTTHEPPTSVGFTLHGQGSPDRDLSFVGCNPTAASGTIP
jgi:hypothetical protein